MTFLPFALPDIGDREVEAAVRALRSGWLSAGPEVQAFEQEFAAYLGPGVHAVAVSSATAGLHLALEASGVSEGDEVIVPTWTFTATAEVVRYLGARPVLVDVDPETLNIDFASAAKAVTSRTRAILPVHFAGQPVDSRELQEFADEHSLMVIEDAAHAFPVNSGSGLVGAGSSAATVFSFYATKTMTTGEGGMVVTRSEALANRIRTMRLHGIDRDAFARYRSNRPAWFYDVVAPGFKYNMADPAAAMGRVQLERAEEMRDRRAEIARAYHAGLADTPIVRPVGDVSGAGHAWHLYVVRLPDAIERDAFIEAMASQGVGTSVHFIPLHLHSYWREYGGYERADLPVASSEFDRVVSLPIFSAMSDADVQKVIGSVRQCLST